MQVNGPDANEQERRRLAARVIELEAAAKAAIRHAEKNGMGDWPVFRKLRKAIKMPNV